MVTSSIPIAKQGGIYKRMETDPEYRARLAAAHLAPMDATVSGALLDAHGDAYGIQRKIIESEC
jgi:hypothetical protein